MAPPVFQRRIAMDGFSYNGIHCSSYGVYYVPDADARWFKEAEYEVYRKEVAWHHGGYMYGAFAKIRTFTVACYFEEITIATREQIRQWLRRDSSGQLVFDERPFVYYNVSPANVVPGKIYNDCGKYSGVFTITFEAVDPFGYLTRKSNDGTEDDNAADYCGIIATSDMPAAPTVSSRAFDVYNPGTEACGLIITVGGSCDNHFRFFNTTNKTQCVISSLPGTGTVLECNGDTGFVKVYMPNTPEYYDNGFAYHDYGMVRLEPGLNEMVIEEQSAPGEWVTPTTLSLSSIAIDYNPRLL